MICFFALSLTELLVSPSLLQKLTKPLSNSAGGVELSVCMHRPIRHKKWGEVSASAFTALSRVTSKYTLSVGRRGAKFQSFTHHFGPRFASFIVLHKE